MIGSLKGIVSYIGPDNILLEVSGVGYCIYLPSRIIANLIEGDNIKIYIHTSVREDDISLYGFPNIEDKNTFLALNKVNGVGAKTALNILGIMTADDISNAIISEDQASFTQVSGIGPKAAQRIIHELKDNIAKLSLLPKSTNLSSDNNNKILVDALSALENLGYQKNQIIHIVKDVIKEEKEISNIITKSLKLISAA